MLSLFTCQCAHGNTTFASSGSTIQFYDGLNEISFRMIDKSMSISLFVLLLSNIELEIVLFFETERHKKKKQIGIDEKTMKSQL